MTFAPERVVRSVVSIFAPQYTGATNEVFSVVLRVGSAALIQKERRDNATYGLWLSSAHCLAPDSGLLFLSFGDADGIAPRIAPAYALFGDRTLDVVAFCARFPTERDADAEPFKIGTRPSTGDYVYAVGWGAPRKGDSLIVAGGIVYDSDESKRRGLITNAETNFGAGCAVRSGDSGGAVLSSQGELVGVIKRGVKRSDERPVNEVDAICVDSMKKILSDARSLFRRAVDKEQKKWSD